MARRSHKHLNILLPPAAAHDTVRHELHKSLEDGPLSAQDISSRISISEKDVYEHLEHIRAILHRIGKRLVIRPAVCCKCGFIFNKRERLTKPSKCPVCRSESIHEPLFSYWSKIILPRTSVVNQDLINSDK